MKKQQRIAVDEWGVKPLVEQSRPVQLILKTKGTSSCLTVPNNRAWKWELKIAHTQEEFKREAIKWILSGAETYGFIMMPPIEWIDRDFINRLSRALEKSNRLSDADMIFKSEWEAGRFKDLEAKEIASQMSVTLRKTISENFVYKRYFYRLDYPYSFKSGPKPKA